MRRLLSAVLGLTCCALGLTCCFKASYAAPPRAERTSTVNPTDLSAHLAPYALDFDGYRVQPEVFRSGEARPGNDRLDLARVAYRISYAGALLLTADRIVRRVDSVLDSMEYTSADGTAFRFNLEPKSKGFEVMLTLSRPIGF